MEWMDLYRSVWFASFCASNCRNLLNQKRWVCCACGGRWHRFVIVALTKISQMFKKMYFFSLRKRTISEELRKLSHKIWNCNTQSNATNRSECFDLFLVFFDWAWARLAFVYTARIQSKLSVLWSACDKNEWCRVLDRVWRHWSIHTKRAISLPASLFSDRANVHKL